MTYANIEPLRIGSFDPEQDFGSSPGQSALYAGADAAEEPGASRRHNECRRLETVVATRDGVWLAASQFLLLFEFRTPLCRPNSKGGDVKRRNVVGPQVRRLRYARGWSQSELAVKLQLAGWDISRSGVAKIEAQLVWVGDFELFYLMKVFQITLPDLLPKLDPGRPVHETVESLMVRKFEV